MRSFFTNRPKGKPIRDTHQLLRQIERKDALFRRTLATFLGSILIALCLLLLFIYHIQSINHQLLQNQDRLLAQNTTLTEQLKHDVSGLNNNTNMRLIDLQNHIDCIVSLFQQPNRTNLVISDIQNCNLSSTPGGSASSTKSQ